MTQPKTQKSLPTKPSAGARKAARKIWRKQYPSLPSVDAATVQNYALIIDREIGVAELLGAARHADVWFDWFYEGKPSTLLRPTANRLKQAISWCESGTGSE